MDVAIHPALVSLWGHPDSTHEQHFLCGGVFVQARTVLTVAHVFDDHAQVWVRPLEGSLQAYPVVGGVRRHPRLDAALLQIEQMPPKASVLTLDTSEGYEPTAHAYTLNGYFEGEMETPQALTITKFDAPNHRHLTTPRHPKGHSGSAVCRAGRLWGLTTEHYLEPTADRGCAIAVHQLWPGWLDGMLGMAAVPSRSTASSTVGQRAVLVDELRSSLAAVFLRPAFNNQSAVPMLDGIPRLLQRQLAVDELDLGKRLVQALITLARQLADVMEGHALNLTPKDRQALKQCLCAAMGCAARLCLDLDKLPAGSALEFVIDIAANTDEGATLAARRQPHRAWKTSKQHGIHALADDFVLKPGIEIGEGKDAQRDLARLVLAREDPTGRVPDQVTEDMLHKLRGFLHNEADEGRTRFFVVRPADLQKFSAELQAWTLQLGVGLIVRRDNDGRLFLYEEDLLLGKLQAFLRVFEEHPEWRAT